MAWHHPSAAGVVVCAAHPQVSAFQELSGSFSAAWHGSCRLCLDQCYKVDCVLSID